MIWWNLRGEYLDHFSSLSTVQLTHSSREYARASTSRQGNGQQRIHRSEIRPDTPVPEEEEEEEAAPAEYNEQGRFTARSKGKGRRN